MTNCGAGSPTCPAPPAGCGTGVQLSPGDLAATVVRTWPATLYLNTAAGTLHVWVVAYAVGRAESRRNPTACNWSDECSVGIWQVFWACHPRYNINSLLDADYNAHAALEISSGGTDWIAWTTYMGPLRDGRGPWLDYIDEAKQAIAAVLAIPPPPPPPPPPPNGTLVTYAGAGGRVWVIVNGQRLEIRSLHTPGDVFAACGYRFGDIRAFPAAEITALPAGPDITGPPCPSGRAASGGSGGILVLLAGLGAAAYGAYRLERSKL